jgi:hypothetical protein
METIEVALLYIVTVLRRGCEELGRLGCDDIE